MTRIVRLAVAVAVLVALFSAPAVASPFEFRSLERPGLGSGKPPQVSAASWILYDKSIGTVIASRNSREMRAPASITKIMTVLLALELGDESDLVSISRKAADTGEREIGLWTGEEVRLGALLRAAMVHSANDAATAIAEHIGGSVDGFVALMNERAKQLGMTRTHFVNPHGLDANGHVTTAEDMLILGLAAMDRADFRDIARAQIVAFPAAPDGRSRRGTASNLMLSSYEGTNGIKTGFTGRAMFTFVASAERDGRELVAVVLGSEGQRGHFADVTKLFDYGFKTLRNYGVLAGLDFPPPMLVSDPSPLTLATELEALVHLAGDGLLTLEPPDEDAPPPGPPIEIAYRRSNGSGKSFWSALTFWMRSTSGS